jgi:uncharacterized protein YqhQ
MNYLRQIWRFLVTLQLLPALESGEETLVGGQAVLEGVMMRSPHAWAISVRKPDGDITTYREPLEKISEKHKWLGWPVIRGVATLGQAMSLGVRALKFSANTALDDPNQKPEDKIQISNWMLAVNVILSVGFFIVAYKLLPLLAATELKKFNPIFNGSLAFNFIDGVIRIAIFLLFIWGVSKMKDIRRVFQFHGAEHKTVFAFEDRADKDSPIPIADAQKYSTFHPRCGTSFLMTVMLISMCIYMLFPVQTFWARFAIRVALLPVIAGVSYELIRFAAKHGKSLFALMTKPGLWLQRITTQPCDDTQVECAIHALDQAMQLEKQRGGELVIA